MGMEVTMEYLTGKTEKKTLGIQDILAGEYEGKEVTPVTHLVVNNYSRIGYVFTGWNTRPEKMPWPTPRPEM